MRQKARGLLISLSAICAATSFAQIPDTANSLDPGGASMAAGGAFYSTNADTHSPDWNPAGLGFVTSRKAGITFRNMPASRSKISGSYTAPVRETSAETGSTELAHIGAVVPVGENAAVGVSYTKAGSVDDVGTGPGAGLPDVSGAIRNYVERRNLDVDIVTIAYGKTNKSQNLSLGAGVAIATAKASYSESGTPVPNAWQPTSARSSGTGAGVIVGAQYIPPKLPNMSIGVSYRSEIKLSGGSSLYSKVPARFVLGAAYRKEGMRRSQDYLVGGIQFEQHFAGQRGTKFDRGRQSGLGLGVEYHYVLPGGDEVPIRLGYRTVSAGGSDFGSRSGFTYGVGYQPRNRDFSVDLSFASYKGKTDFGLSATFRFK